MEVPSYNPQAAGPSEKGILDQLIQWRVPPPCPVDYILSCDLIHLNDQPVGLVAKGAWWTPKRDRDGEPGEGSVESSAYEGTNANMCLGGALPGGQSTRRMCCTSGPPGSQAGPRTVRIWVMASSASKPHASSPSCDRQPRGQWDLVSHLTQRTTQFSGTIGHHLYLHATGSLFWTKCIVSSFQPRLSKISRGQIMNIIRWDCLLPTFIISV